MTLSLVTGGNGFIGQHLVAALRAHGDFVRVLDTRRPILSHTERGPHEFVHGSVNDPQVVCRCMKDVDFVYHLAALTHLWLQDRREFDAINRGGTEVVLTAALEHPGLRFVHCSTDAILLSADGRGAADPESTRLGLDDMAGPYTRSKLLAERAAIDASKKGLSVVIVNPTVPIGPGDHSVTPPTAMLRMFLRRPPKFAPDLNLVDVRDVVEGMMLAAHQGRPAERYILGGENVRLGDLIQRIARFEGRRSSPTRIPSSLALALGALSEWTADYLTGRPPAATAEGIRLATWATPLGSTKARRELGYQTRPMNASLDEALSWIKQFLISEEFVERSVSPSIQSRSTVS